MAFILTVLGGILGLGSLVCFIMVLIKIFQSGQTGLGIACLVLLFCFGIGGLVTFVVGWMNATKWNIKNIMLGWTGCIVGSVICSVLQVALQ